MANIIKSDSIAPTLPADDYFTPEARALCCRVKHKSELTDDETLMLAVAAAQAALARYFHPGTRSAEEALEAIAAILDHEDVVAALKRKLRTDAEKEKAFEKRLERTELEPQRKPMARTPISSAWTEEEIAELERLLELGLHRSR
jgi:hypothetical protein